MKTMREPRALYIKARLDHELITEYGVSVATPEPTFWYEEMKSLGRYAVLGWGAPIENLNYPEDEDASPLLVPFCPEVIDDLTQDLSDKELYLYLSGISLMCVLHAEYWDNYQTPEDRYDDLDMYMKEEFPKYYEPIEEAMKRAGEAITDEEQDLFTQITSNVEDIWDWAKPDDITPVDEMADLHLMTKYQEVRKALLDSREMMSPHTDAGRELHSQRAALLIEMKRRGLY